MWMPLLLLTQSTTIVEPPRVVIDLLPKPCAKTPGQSDEVVVCAQRAVEEPYRIGPTTEAPPALPEAKIGIGKATLAAEAQKGEVGGIPTNRAMITLKFKF